MTKHTKMSDYIVDRLVKGTDYVVYLADTTMASEDLDAFILKQTDLPEVYVFVYPNEVHVEFDYHDPDLFPVEITVIKTNDPQLFEKGQDFLKKTTAELKKIVDSGKNVQELAKFRA
jgi:hypothetical protein